MVQNPKLNPGSGPSGRTFEPEGATGAVRETLDCAGLRGARGRLSLSDYLSLGRRDRVREHHAGDRDQDQRHDTPGLDDRRGRGSFFGDRPTLHWSQAQAETLTVNSS
jgi:hypothetical protein